MKTLLLLTLTLCATLSAQPARIETGDGFLIENGLVISGPAPMIGTKWDNSAINADGSLWLKKGVIEYVFSDYRNCKITDYRGTPGKFGPEVTYKSFEIWESMTAGRKLGAIVSLVLSATLALIVACCLGSSWRISIATVAGLLLLLVCAFLQADSKPPAAKEWMANAVRWSGVSLLPLAFLADYVLRRRRLRASVTAALTVLFSTLCIACDKSENAYYEKRLLKMADETSELIRQVATKGGLFSTQVAGTIEGNKDYIALSDPAKVSPTTKQRLLKLLSEIEALEAKHPELKAQASQPKKPLQ